MWNPPTSDDEDSDWEEQEEQFQSLQSRKLEAEVFNNCCYFFSFCTLNIFNIIRKLLEDQIAMSGDMMK